VLSLSLILIFFFSPLYAQETSALDDDQQQELELEAPGGNCRFMLDPELVNQLIPRGASIQGLRDEVAALRMQQEQNQSETARACDHVGRQLEISLESIMMTDDETPGPVDQGNDAAAEQRRITHAQRCREERMARPSETARCTCDPIMCRNRIVGLMDQVQRCSQDRPSVVSTYTSVMMSTSIFLGQGASLLAFGIGTFSKVVDLFKRRQRSTDHELQLNEFINRNVACAVNESFYNIMCPGVQLDVVTNTRNAPPTENEARGFQCNRMPRHHSTRQGIKAIYECLEDGGDREQCYACNLVTINGQRPQVVNLGMRTSLRTAINDEAATVIAIQQGALANLLEQSRNYHQQEAERLHTYIRTSYGRASATPGWSIEGVIAEDQHVQLIRHCYYGYLSQNIAVPRRNEQMILEVLNPDSQDRRFREICEGLNQCAMPTASSPYETFSYQNFRPGGNGSMSATCNSLYRLESRQLNPDVVYITDRLADANFGTGTGGCRAGQNQRPGNGRSNRQ
jgi:hypothetical protein